MQVNTEVWLISVGITSFNRKKKKIPYTQGVLPNQIPFTLISSNRIVKYTEDELVVMASKGNLNAFNQLVSNYQNMA